MRHYFLSLKSVKKILIYTGASVVLIIVLAAVGGWLFKDKIINKFITEANKQLATPVKIGKIDISLFSHFPSVTIDLKDVYVEDSYKEIFPLFTAEQLSLSFNGLDAWQGKYIVQSLFISKSETNIRINKKGVGNFQVMKDTAARGQSFKLDLKNISLKKTAVSYLDEGVEQSHEFTSSSLYANVSLSKKLYTITANGDVISKQISIRNNSFLRDKLFNISLSMTYDHEQKLVVFNPSSLNQEQGEFELKGKINLKNETELALSLQGKETTLQTIISLLPESWTHAVEQYESKGDLYFNLNLTGKTSKPLLSIDFGCNKATLFHPQTNFKITQTNLKGNFQLKGFSDFNAARISLKDVTGKLNDKDFTGQFNLINFNNPYVDFNFKGELNVSTIQEFFGKEILTEASGNVTADVALAGEILLLKKKTTAQQVKISGSVELHDVLLTAETKNISLQNLNGNLQFNNNDLVLSDVKGTIGKSDFLLNGYFKNVVSYLLFDDQPIGIETDLRSQYLELEELLQMGFGKENVEGYQFNISPNVYLNFNCNIAKLKFRKFKATQVEGNLTVKNQIARSKNFKMKTLGGNVSLSGSMAAIKKEPVELITNAKLKSINIDSLFYVFGNFRQDFIQDKNLKGIASADIVLETNFARDLKIIPASLVANMDFQIKNGELNNFEPLQDLKKYLDDDGLKTLRFAELKNEIHVENETILIPLMEIRSNVTTIQLSGKHTFDQKIDYHIVAPLRNKGKVNINEAGEAYQQGLDGRIKVYFKITGTTDNYKVAYDKEALKNKLNKGLKKEFEELKDAFKDKDKKKKKELELEKDDYFEWDN